jgi:hypothetical protein
MNLQIYKILLYEFSNKIVYDNMVGNGDLMDL